MKTNLLSFRKTVLSLMFMLSFVMGWGQVNITPIRTDVSGFASWTDANVGGSTYLQLISNTSSTISPALNFDVYTNETLDFKARTFGGPTVAQATITVSISINDGLNWSVLGTRTPATTGLLSQTQFDLSSYNGNKVKIKFETLGASSSKGVGIDDIVINGIEVTTVNPEPTNHPTTFTCGTTTATSIPLTWVDAVGTNLPSKYLIKWSSVSFADIATPTDGTAVANGAGAMNVNFGVQAADITGLTPNTTYYFKIFPYSNSGSNIDYKTNGTIAQTICTTQNGPCFTGNAPNFTTGGYTAVGHTDSGGSPTNTISLASGSQVGSVSTTATGVTAGDVTLKFRAKGWSGTETNVRVTLDGQVVNITDLPTVFGWYTLNFTSVTANPTLTFSTVINKRVHLGNVEIMCTPSVPKPIISVTPSGNHAFGSQLVGSSSAAASFTIKNTGTLPLTLGTIALSNINADQYSVTQPGSTTLAPNDTTTFTATFSPTSIGAKTATVTIPNNTGTDYTFNLTGTGDNNSVPNNATMLKACIANSQITLNWTASTGTPPTGYIVYALAGTTAPAMVAGSAGNASGYVANSDFSLANAYTTLGKAVYKGNGTSATITGLTQGQEYSFKVVAYNGETATGWANGIASTTSQSWWQTYTIKVPEVGSPAATVAPTSSSVLWTVVPASVGCYEYMVVANQGAVSFTPTGDGSAYTAVPAYSGANQVVYKGTGGSVTVTGLTEGLQYCYKIFVREINSNQWSEGTSVCQTTGLSYCPSSGNTDYGTGITGVEFNTINNPSILGDQGAYTDNTAISTSVNIGETYDLSVRVNTDGNFTANTKVWIDWNRNGAFDVSTEEYDLGTATNVTNGDTEFSPLSVTVPSTAQSGTTRMRVSTKYNTYATPCDTGYDGEVEDYTVIIGKPANAEINVKGNNISIPSGSTVVNGLNNTLFAATNVGSSSIEKTFTIENLGLSILALTGSPIVNLVGDHPGDFTVTEYPAAATIAVNGTLTFKIRFNPSTADVRSAIVSISNNDPTGNENPYTFKIQGTGQCTTPPVITMTPTSGPANTLVTLVSTVNNLTGATVKLNGATITPVSISTGEITFKIPAGAVDGNVTVILSTGCVFTQTFDVVTYENNGCEGSSGSLPTDLIIYEVYDEEKGSGGFVSIFNATSSAKNLSSYEIYRAGDNPIPVPYTTGLSGIINPGELKIIKYSGVNACPVPISTGNGSFGSGFNGGDVFQLRSFDGSVIYDAVEAPIDKGYYMKRAAGQFLGSTVYVPAYWSTVNLIEGDCLPAGITPVLPGGNTPMITEQPVFAPTCENIQLSVAAEQGVAGGFGLAYQWYVLAPNALAWTAIADNVIYSGATTATLTISSPSGLDQYQYYVQVRENGVTCYKASDAMMIHDGETKWNGSVWTKGLPQTWSKVVIEGDYNTEDNGALDICELVVNSGTFIIKKDYPVKVQNKVTNNTAAINFLIESDGNLVQNNDLAVNTGPITVNRISPMKKNNYTYWSSPVSGQNLWNFSSGTSHSRFYIYNEGDNKFYTTGLNASSVFTPGKGYAIMAPTGYTTTATTDFPGKFVGVPTNGTKKADTSSLEFPLQLTPITPNRGFNMIGNPYPSNIDFEVLYALNSTKIYNTAYFWTNVDPNRPSSTNGNGDAYTGNAYAIYNGTGGVPATTSGPGTGDGGTSLTPTQFIKVGQGFIVKAKQSGQLIFNNSIRNAVGSSNFMSKGASSDKDRYWLKLTTPAQNVNTILIGYIAGATNDFERDYDAPLMSVASDSFYSILNENKLGIQGKTYPLNTSDVVPLGTKHFEDGNYTVSLGDKEGIFANGQNIYLKDNQTGIITNLSEGSYSFNSAVGEFSTRFEIIYRPQVVLATDGATKENLQVYRDGTDFVVKSSDKTITRLEVYDGSGRMLMKIAPKNKEARIPAAALSNGMYILLIDQHGEVTSRKVVK